MPSGRAHKPNGPAGTSGAALQLLHPGRLAVAVPGQPHSIVVYCMWVCLHGEQLFKVDRWL